MSEPFRVIVIEDDPDVALFSKTVLEKRDLCTVLTIADPRIVGTSVLEFKPDLVVTDIELPGASGLELIGVIRELRPGIPIIVMTAHASVDYAVSALRQQADEFLTKPITSADLVGHVTRLAAIRREAAESAPQREVVLAIGAHPDDVEVGVGGILAAHMAAGDTVTILTLSRGMRNSGIQGAWNESSNAAAVIGAQVLLEDLPGHALSGSTEITEMIRKVVHDVKPTIVYSHSKNDDNQDHRAVHDATLVNTAKVRTVACYQGTAANVEFRPNRFVTVDGFIDKKVAMLECFAQDADRPDYLAPDFALATARSWSRYGQGEYCEPLEIVRDSATVT
jgi:LmbE family N-acetylglucosaminyl deacetylase/AmiR/NasT family two-component response regulator